LAPELIRSADSIGANIAEETGRYSGCRSSPFTGHCSRFPPWNRALAERDDQTPDL